ncbi:MAG: hypothetical protein AAGG48_23755 [Planctomycetota bacterium]
MTMVVALLLLASLSLIGMVSAWAIESKLPWQFRGSLIVIAVLLPWPIPAFEIVVVFAVQCSVVTLGLRITRFWMQSRRKGRAEPLTRFSIRSVLLVTVLIALATAVYAGSPSLGSQAWVNVATIGVCAGFSTLLGVWVCAVRSRRIWLCLPFAILGCLLMSFGLSQFDFALAALADGVYAPWPPSDEVSIVIPLFFATPEQLNLFIPWSIVFAGITVLHVIVARLITCAVTEGWSMKEEPGSRIRAVACWIARGLLLVLIFLMILPTAYIYLRLLTPIPIPEERIVEKNGWNYFIEAGQLAENNSELSQIRYQSWDGEEPTRDEVSKAVASLAPVFDIIDRGAKLSTCRPLEYGPQDIDVSFFMSFRSLSGALEFQGRLKELDGQYGAAAVSYLQAARLGFAVRRGGYVIDLWIGEVCANDGIGRLYHCRDKLSKPDRVKISSTLASLAANAEPLQRVLHREQIFGQRSEGWRGHLWQILNDPKFELDGLVEEAYTRHNAERSIIHLLRVELAILTFRDTTGDFPASLQDLVPDYLEQIPLDPFSPSAEQLRFRTTDDGYLLYSIGVNGIDDRGNTWEDSTTGFYGADIRLDHVFADEEPSDEE